MEPAVQSWLIKSLDESTVSPLCWGCCQAQTVRVNAKSNKIDYIFEIKDMITFSILNKFKSLFWKLYQFCGTRIFCWFTMTLFLSWKINLLCIVGELRGRQGAINCAFLSEKLNSSQFESSGWKLDRVSLFDDRPFTE